MEKQQVLSAFTGTHAFTCAVVSPERVPALCTVPREHGSGGALGGEAQGRVSPEMEDALPRDSVCQGCLAPSRALLVPVPRRKADSSCQVMGHCLLDLHGPGRLLTTRETPGPTPLQCTQKATVPCAVSRASCAHCDILQKCWPCGWEP